MKKIYLFYLLIITTTALQADTFENGQKVGSNILSGALGIVSGSVHKAKNVLTGKHSDHLHHHHNKHQVTKEQSPKNKKLP